MRAAVAASGVFRVEPADDNPVPASSASTPLVFGVAGGLALCLVISIICLCRKHRRDEARAAAADGGLIGNEMQSAATMGASFIIAPVPRLNAQAASLAGRVSLVAAVDPGLKAGAEAGSLAY